MSDLLLLRSDIPAETMAMPVVSAESLQNSTRNMQLSAMVAAEYANQFLPHLDTNTLSSISQFVADTQTLASQPEKIVDNLFRANELTKSQVRGMVSRRVGSTSKDPGAGDKPVDGSSPSGLDTDTMDTIDAIVDRATGSFVGAFSDRTSQLSETVAATSEHLAAIADKRRGTNIVTRALRWLGSNPVEFERSRKEAEIDKRMPLKDTARERDIRKLATQLAGVAKDLNDPAAIGLSKRIAEQAQKELEELTRQLIMAKNSKGLGSVASKPETIYQPKVRDTKNSPKAALVTADIGTRPGETPRSSEISSLGEYVAELPWMEQGAKVSMLETIDSDGKKLYITEALSPQLKDASDKQRQDPTKAKLFNGMRNKIVSIFQGNGEFATDDIRTIHNGDNSPYSGFSISYTTKEYGGGLRLYMTVTTAGQLSIGGKEGSNIDPTAKVVIFLGECDNKTSQRDLLKRFDA